MVSFVKVVILNTAQIYLPLSADSECVLKRDKTIKGVYSF